MKFSKTRRCFFVLCLNSAFHNAILAFSSEIKQEKQSKIEFLLTFKYMIYLSAQFTV